MEDITSPRVLRETLARYRLAPRKALGQNFLIDANLRKKIVAAAAPGPDDVVIEVGPGPGALTAELLATGAAVLAVEADAGLARILSDRQPPVPGRFSIVVADILRTDLPALVSTAGFAGRPCMAVANLPYYITTPALFHLLEARLPWRRMVFLVQREVAQRLAAAPGSKDYGLLSVMTQCRASVSVLTALPPTVFWPPPKVHSALVRLELPGPCRLSETETARLAELARAAFGQRRKTIGNACRYWAERRGLGAAFPSLCRRAGIDPAVRAEDLSVEDYVRLAKIVTQWIAPGPSVPGAVEREADHAIHQPEQGETEL